MNTAVAIGSNLDYMNQLRNTISIFWESNGVMAFKDSPPHSQPRRPSSRSGFMVRASPLVANVFTIPWPGSTSGNSPAARMSPILPKA
jgi:hypothetical protein